MAEETIVTQLVQFQVADGRADALIAGITAEVEAWVRLQPGFISATFHKSLDGRHVFNYAQWQSEADLHAFAQSTLGARIGDVIQRVGIEGPPDIRTYRAVRRITPGGAD